MFYAYLIIMEDNLHLYVLDKNRVITDSIDNHFITEGLIVNTFEYDDAIAGITKVVGFTKKARQFQLRSYYVSTHVVLYLSSIPFKFKVRPTNGKVLLSAASEAISYLIQPHERRIVAPDSPICALKNIKNPVEVNGMRAANIRDSATVIAFLHWLENEIDVGNITELKSVEKLKSMKRYSINPNLVISPCCRTNCVK